MESVRQQKVKQSGVKEDRQIHSQDRPICSQVIQQAACKSDMQKDTQKGRRTCRQAEGQTGRQPDVQAGSWAAVCMRPVCSQPGMQI